jgi:hypothetical protein
MRTTPSILAALAAVLCPALCLSLAGCAAFDKGHLDPRVASQVHVTKLDPPSGCEYLGEVKGTAPLGELADAHGDVLRNAVLRGGNYVSVDLVERPVVLGLGSYVIRGRLFTCPSPGAPAAQAQATRPPAPPPADATMPRPCDPECASGFTCQLGTCVASPASQAAGPAN